MKKANIMQHKKAFTLVELIVVITILAILWTIGFISIQNYSKEARDSKRLTDVRSLLTKLSLEQTTSWLPYKKLLITTIPHTVYVGWKPNSEAYQWIVDFELLKESQKNFQDPESNTDYDFATVKWKAEYNWTPQNYDFIQGRYWSEKNNEQVILGNYYQYETWDNEHLFKDTLTWPNESTDTPPITQLWNCDDTSKPTDNGHIEYTPWNPSNQNTPWTQAPSWDCTYQCKDWYTWTDCNTPPVTIINWECDTTNNTPTHEAPTTNLCISWNANTPSENWTTWTWKCISPNWWTDDTCTSPRAYCNPTQPTIANTKTTTWIPSQTNQAWQSTNPTWACYYTCAPWYDWTDASKTACYELTYAWETTPSWTCTQTTAPQYTWWTCTATCGTWNQTATACTPWEWTQTVTTVCKNTTTNQTVSDELCTETRPTTEQCTIPCANPLPTQNCNTWIACACWTANNTNLATKPSTQAQLCINWTANTVTWTWPWTWECASNVWTEKVTCKTNAYCATRPTWTNIASFNDWTPTSSNQSWVQWSWACSYTCKTNYSWIDCATYTPPLPDWVTLWNATTWLWCTGTDIIIKKWTTNLTMAWCNSKNMWAWITAYTEQNCIDKWTSTASHCQWDYYTWANAASACPSPRRLPTKDELDKIVTNLWWWSISPMGSPYYLTLAGLNGGTSVGYGVRYWSSTERYANNAYFLYVDSSGASVYYDYKTYAFSVRCVKN